MAWEDRWRRWLSAPKRYDIVYPSQAVAMTACAALPAETHCTSAFLGYNSRPWAHEAGGLQSALARDVSRAQTYPMLLDC